MPINNQTFTRGPVYRVKGKAEKASKDKNRYTEMNKYTIKFSKNKLEFEKTRTFY